MAKRIQKMDEGNGWGSMDEGGWLFIWMDYTIYRHEGGQKVCTHSLTHHYTCPHLPRTLATRTPPLSYTHTMHAFFRIRTYTHTTHVPTYSFTHVHRWYYTNNHSVSPLWFRCVRGYQHTVALFQELAPETIKLIGSSRSHWTFKLCLQFIFFHCMM